MESSVDFCIIRAITSFVEPNTLSLTLPKQILLPSFFFLPFVSSFFRCKEESHTTITWQRRRRIYRRRVTSPERRVYLPLLFLEFTRTLITVRLKGRRNNEHWVQVNSGSQVNRKVDGLAPTVFPSVSLSLGLFLALTFSPISRVRAHVHRRVRFDNGGGWKERERERETHKGDCTWVALHCWLSCSWKIGWAKL